MADNYNFTEGSGRTARAREISGALLPYVGAVTATPTCVFFAHYNLTTAATSLPSAPASYSHAIMSVGTEAYLRYRPDATNPNATVGHLVSPVTVVEFTNGYDVRLVGMATVPIDVSYYRYA